MGRNPKGIFILGLILAALGAGIGQGQTPLKDQTPERRWGINAQGGTADRAFEEPAFAEKGGKVEGASGVSVSWVVVGALVMAGVFFVIHELLRWQNRRKLSEIGALNARLQKELADRKKAEDVLRARTRWYQTLFYNTRDMVFIHSITPDGVPGKFIEVNDTASAILGHSREKLLTMSPVDIEATQLPGAAPGYSREDLVTLNVDDILQREKTFTAQRMVKELTEKKHITYERTCTTQDGKEIPVEMTSRLINVQGQPVVITTGEDITARKTAEQALHTSDRRLHDFFDHSPIGIALYDAKAALVDVNQAYLKMFGLTDRQGFARYGLFDLPYVAEQNRKALSKGDTVQYETIVDFEGLRRTPYFSTTRTGQVHYEIIINNLGLDEAFNPKGYLFQVQDITKRRAAETALLQSERQLRQAQKMEALGTMAGGIAHDFNNVLTPILGYAEIAMRLCPETDPRLQYLTEIFNASLRAKDLVTQILTFSRQTEQERKPVKITPILKEVLKLMRATLPATIEIRSMLKAERDLVMGDPTQIHQVLILKSA